MAGIRWLETDTLSNQNISSPLAVGAYTAAADRAIMVQVFVDQAAGNGDYVMYATLQIGGSGSAYVILPKTTMAAASGETAIAGQSGWINVRNGDIVTVYVDGLAGDTATPDTIVRWFEDAALQPTVADRTLDVSAGGEAGVDWANVGSPTTTVGLSGTTIKTATDVEADTGDILDGYTYMIGDGSYTLETLGDAAENIQGRLPAALTANGNMKSSLMEILATALTETAGQIAAGFKKLFNVATPVMTVESVNQSGDSYEFIAEELAALLVAIVEDTSELQTDWVNGGRLDLLIDAIKAKTDNLPASPAAVGSAMTLADDSITSAKFDESTAFPIASADTGATQIARVGADGDTLETLSDQIDGTATAASIAALNNLSAAEVNAEVVDALNVDTYAEPGQGAPAATASLAAKINYLFKSWRNKKTQTATTRSIYNDAGDTVDQAATDGDDGSTLTKGEIGSGA